MVYQLERMVRDVRVCLDENMTGAALIASGDLDTLSTDDIIRSKLPEAVRRVHTEAPVWLIDTGHNFSGRVYWGDLESGWVLLPEDFMRLVVFEMDDWERAVYSAIVADDASYVRQRSRIKGLRGTSQRPVCVLGIRPEGKVLEFYSCKSCDAQVRRAVYLPYPSVDAYGGIEVCERCYEAVVYTAAGLTLMTYGEADRGEQLSGLAKTFLQQ